MRECDRKVRSFEEDSGRRDRFHDIVRNIGVEIASAPLLLYGPPLPIRARILVLAHLASVTTLLVLALSVVVPKALLVAVLGALACIVVRLVVHKTMTEQGPALEALADLMLPAEALGEGPALRTFRAAIAAYGLERKAVLEELGISLLTFLNVFLLLDVLAFLWALRIFRSSKALIVSTYEKMGELDAARSVASFRASTNVARPTFRASGSKIEMRGLRPRPD
jgi:hypothetical protein